MSEIEIVFFDAGETLLTPKPSWSELAVDKLAERGHDVTVEQMREAWRLTGRHFTEAAEQGVNISESHDASHYVLDDAVPRSARRSSASTTRACRELLYEVFSDPRELRPVR